MALWTDLVTPAELTGYTRQSLSDYEAQRGTLARFLRKLSGVDVAATEFDEAGIDRLTKRPRAEQGLVEHVFEGRRGRAQIAVQRKMRRVQDFPA